MSPELQEDVFRYVDEITKDGDKPVKELAALLKKHMDQTHDGIWHVIIGTDFGSYVSHEAGKFLHFYIGDRAFMLFKTAR